jgi:hypothetical protein
VRIDVTYAGRAPRVIETSGESLLSSATLSAGPAGGTPVTAVMLRPRLDLLGKGGHGLAIEVCGWSTATFAGSAKAEVADLGGSWQVPLLSFHVFRVWEVLPADELADVVAIDIDSRMHVMRIGGDLLDLTAYEACERELLSAAEVSGNALFKRVYLVHDRAKQQSPGIDDEAVGARYGLGTRLIDWARNAAAEPSASGVPVGSGVDDGLSDLMAELTAAASEQDLAAVVERAILDRGLSLKEVMRACETRKLRVEGLERIWSKVEDELWG